ncbi:pentapeptide repeat-containing protein [Natrinema pallidum]|uniref:pentapeptide repeat-containing protein n=1 Tax=Natrinema pallidum TaxID=69527 RepID=UPI0015867057|nr:pentapeptide repeat-containing protein [Natrinema pallidum]
MTTNDDAPDELGGVCCWRKTWNETNYCIWHAEEYGKPNEELVDARSNQPERIDKAYLCGITPGNKISFKDCTLWKADFNPSRLSDANFVGCYLHGADFTGTHIDGANFTDCHADHADFQNIEGRGAYFTNASLAHANFSTENQIAGGLAYAEFNKSDLFDATFRNTYLQQADFSDSRLTHVSFVDAVPEQADFDGADVRDADFTHSKLDGAYFADARISTTTDFGEVVAYERLADRKAENSSPVAKLILDIQRLISFILYSPYLWLRRRFDSESKKYRHQFPLHILSYYSKIPGALPSPPHIDRNRDLSDSASELVFDTEGKLLQPIIQYAENRLRAAWRFYNRLSPEIAFQSDDKRELKAAERTYRNYQSILDGTPQRDAKLNFSLREKAARRKLAWSSGDVWQWLKLSLARWTTYHGESPWRLGILSGAIIGIFSLLYPYYGLLVRTGDGESCQVAYDASTSIWSTFGKSLYFSITSFIYPGYGEVQPIGAAEYLAITETLLGAIVVALLVFVLGRRAAH